MNGKRTESKTGFRPIAGLHIVAIPGQCGGKPHIAGHRIKVQHVAVWHNRLGKSPDEIVAEHAGLTLADVYAALAHYYDHRAEIDADIEADGMLSASVRGQCYPSKLLTRIASSHGPNDPVSP